MSLVGGSRRLFVASHNCDKLREIGEILDGSGWEIVFPDQIPPYPEPGESGATLAENALIKAREGYSRSGLLTLADDSGLEVDALDGRPGVRSARYAGKDASYRDNIDLLLLELKGVPPNQRTARFRAVMALVSDAIEQTWEGVVEGRILTAPLGETGFGYDPVFWSVELGCSFAEVPPQVKHTVSHRARALAGLLAHLNAAAR
ncbi:MAG: non-canonical purine NTP pyrophosphatase [Calditrichaeota bacterium]|nr:non-canonical purine NTP pyrophosphatase [Calditrichota bacterium]